MKFVATLIALSSLAANAAPFDTGDQNPLFVGFGQPHPFLSRFTDHTTSIAATLNWSSTAVIQRAGNEDLLVDAETREWRIALEHTLSERFAFRLDLPYRTINGGTLDNFISHWHSAFGFPKGDRPALPVNDFRVQYLRASQSTLSFTRDESGLGDAQVAFGYQLPSTAQHDASVWWSVKFPTAHSDTLIGGHAYDSSVSLAERYDLSRRWSAFGQLNATYLGAGELLPAQQQRLLWSGFLGADYHYSAALALTLQLDAHTAAFKDSSLDLLGNAWILTVGGDYRFSSGWRAQFGVSEDVKVDASPDVAFVLTMKRSW